jgi:integrase
VVGVVLSGQEADPAGGGKVLVPSSRMESPRSRAGVLESARRRGDSFYAAVVQVLVLGLRKGELLGLAWEDVDLDAGRAERGLATPAAR